MLKTGKKTLKVTQSKIYHYILCVVDDNLLYISLLTGDQRDFRLKKKNQQNLYQHN